MFHFVAMPKRTAAAAAIGRPKFRQLVLSAVPLSSSSASSSSSSSSSSSTRGDVLDRNYSFRREQSPTLASIATGHSETVGCDDDDDVIEMFERPPSTSSNGSGSGSCSTLPVSHREPILHSHNNLPAEQEPQVGSSFSFQAATRHV